MSNIQKKLGFLVFILIAGFLCQITEKAHIPKKKKKIVPILLSNDDTLVNDLNATWAHFDWDLSANSLAIDTSGNIFFTGSWTDGDGRSGGGEMFLRKYDNTGSLDYHQIWGTIYSDEIGNALALDHLGNIFIAGDSRNRQSATGITRNNAFLIKYDNNGLFQWNLTWIRSSFNAIAVDSLGYVYLTGRSGEESNSNMYLVKCDNYGNQEWARTWDRTSSGYEAGEAIALDSSGNIYIVGTSNNNAFLVKYDNTGNQKWNRIWSGVGEDFGTSVAIDLYGNLYIAGCTSNYGAGLRDLFLVKCDANGIEEWYRTWGGVDEDYTGKVALDTSGNIYLAGTSEYYRESFSNSRISLVKYDNSGRLQWNRSWEITRESNIVRVAIGDIKVDREGNIYIIGDSKTSPNQIFLTKFGIDFDRDGLSNWQESNIYSTDPYITDTDGDRLSDYEEVIIYLTNPNSADTDGDHLSDYAEIISYSTDPNNIDSDGDGFNDEIEVTLGYDPLNFANSPLIFLIIITITVIAALISVSIFLLLRFKKNKIKKATAGIVEKSVGKTVSKPLYVKATEEEVSISTEKKICLVCKNELSRGNYICPECNAFYCENCARALVYMENACWVCNAPFDPSKPSKPFEKQEMEEEIVTKESENGKKLR